MSVLTCGKKFRFSLLVHLPLVPAIYFPAMSRMFEPAPKVKVFWFFSSEKNKSLLLSCGKDPTGQAKEVLLF